MTHLIITKSFI